MNRILTKPKITLLNDSDLFPERKYLPPEILERAVLSGNEYGWKRADFTEVVDTAVQNGLAVIGGQVQFRLSDGTCELYWHKYDPHPRNEREGWDEYCQRTKTECLAQFAIIPNDKELIGEGIRTFSFLSKKANEGIRLEEFLIFIIYFDDSKTSKR